jgi:GNAT superfamily N-acetyltransferase
MTCIYNIVKTRCRLVSSLHLEGYYCQAHYTHLSLPDPVDLDSAIMATTPLFSEPTLYTISDLKSDPSLVSQITDLINEAFSRSKKADPVKWRQGERRRFPNDELYFEMLGTDGIAAIIFDITEEKRKVVAVAAAVPWQGGWKKEGAGSEEGWEIKAVAVDADAKYLRRGLAVRLYAFLEQHLILKSKTLGMSTTGRKFGSTDQLALWILAAECINGPYWRKRGYELVRQETAEPPTWGVLTSFEMIVLRKDIPFELAEKGASFVAKPVDQSTRQEIAVN